MIKRLIKLASDETGATSVEYGLLVALIAAIIVTAVATLGTATLGLFNSLVWP